MLITNEGRKIPLNEEDPNITMNDSPSKQTKNTMGKHKKKVLSKPIENAKTVIDH